jgi:hypothetical protein
MHEAWISLQCPDCGRTWEANPSDLPEPESSFVCAGCHSRHPIPEFMKTTRSFEIYSSLQRG